MKLNQLLPGLEVVQLVGDPGVEINGVQYDSRRIRPGDLFVAVPGLKNDGHLFVDGAVEAGAAAVVVERMDAAPSGAVVVQVRDSRTALSRLAAAFYGEPGRRLRMIGVTGTNGKTTTTHLIEAMLKAAGRPTGLLGTIGGRMGEQSFPVAHTTPESLDLQELLARMLREGAECVVMEVSSHALALKRVADCEFDVGVFTNLTQDHLDFHTGMDDYREAKQLLFSRLGEGEAKTGTKYAVINRDDPAAEFFIQASTAPVITFGINSDAAVSARDLEITLRGVSFTAVTPGGEIDVQLQISGRFNVYNALAAVAVGWREGIDPAVIRSALAGVEGVPGRFEAVSEGQEFAVVVDYAHTPDGMENVLSTARGITRERLITVFGCGGDRDRTKRPLMGEAAARWSDYVIVTSDNPRTENPGRIIDDILPGVSGMPSERYEVIEDRRSAIRRAVGMARPGDIVVIAGKGHETYQIVGTETFPFDDRKVAREALRERRE
ncbi:MAG: UDP-N-acetylmuramoyl-L-alanyl-D-glutamate--2,6-diaminopimelate ligase [Firmicutes bacterium]|nr:UDP-N-acetylmuramoyl-L-alanyl-D-glutamate--2,6-diaminopimelate ligase [Bacillota bacterium]